MKTYRLIPIIAIFISGCKGCRDSADEEKIKTDTINQVLTDSTAKTPDTTSVKIPDSETPADKPAESSGQTREVAPKKDPGILVNIDQHVISTPKFTAGANGGISQATVTVKNNLSGVSFQKIIIEVVIMKNTNTPVAVNYYTVVNLSPGESKQVNIPDNPEGTKIVAHVVKVSSNELTNGESVLAGKQYQTQ